MAIGVRFSDCYTACQTCKLTLDVDLPLGEITLVDGLEEILGGVVWGLSGELGSLFLSQELDSLLGEEMSLGIDPVTGLVNELEGVSRVTLHLAVSVWNTTVTEEPHDLVDGLWVVAEVVPEHGRVSTTSKML